MMKACCSQRIVQLVAVGVAFLMMPLFSYAAQSQKTNTIQNLSLKHEKGSTLLVVHGTRTPVFSSFQLKEPHRLVIDFRQANLQSLASSMQYRTGLVRHIGVQQFSSAINKMGRLVLHLRGVSRWNLKRKGTNLHVRLWGKASAMKPVQVAPAPAAAPRTVTRRRGTVRRTGILSGPQGRAGRLLRRVSHTTSSVTFHLNGVVGQYEVLQLSNPSRLVVDLYRVRKAFRRTLRVSCGAQSLQSIRFGRHRRKLRVVLDSCGGKRAFKSFHASATTSGLRVSFALKGQTQNTLLQPLKLAAVPKVEVQHIGLSETTSASVLMIRTNSRNPQVRVFQNSAGYTLRLQGAVLPNRLARKMDTSDFRGVIRQVKPVQQGDFVEIQVRVSQNVPFQLKRKGEMLLWSFLMPRKKLMARSNNKKGTYRISFHPKKVGQARLSASPGRLAGGVLSNRQVMASLANNTSQRKYTGRRVSLYFQKVEAHNLLNLFAELSGFNIIISQSVRGRVTLKLRNVPWDQALALVMKTLKLGMERDGNVIRIAPLAQLQQERTQRRKMEQLKLMTPPMKIRLIPVNYGNASTMAGKVKTVLSPKGKVSIDSRTNVLIVQDYVPFLIRAEGLVRSLDTQTPQVLIEARIVEANVNFDQQFGIQWGGHLLFGPLTGTSTGLVFPNPIGVRGGGNPAAGGGAAGGGGQAQAAGQGFGSPNYVINFPASTGAGRGTALDFLFGSLTGIASVSLRLSAAESKGYVKIISSPKIITLHKKSAQIQQGIQIPFSSASAAGTNVQFVQANLSLSVTPQVTSDGSVFLQMNVTNNAPDFSKAGANGPSISTKSATTKMLIKDGETMVIGGIYSRRTGGAQARVPFLSSIPILGALFRNYQFNDDRAELLVFVTPRIINRAKTIGGRKSN